MTTFQRLNSVLVVGALAAASQNGHAQAAPAVPTTWSLECARPAPPSGRFVPDDAWRTLRVLPSGRRFREGSMTAAEARWRPGLPARRLTSGQCDRVFPLGGPLPTLTAEVAPPMSSPRLRETPLDVVDVLADSPAGGATSPTSLAPQWNEGAQYAAGQVVLYRERWYRCLQPHRAWPGAGWSPDALGVLNVLWMEI